MGSMDSAEHDSPAGLFALLGGLVLLLAALADAESLLASKAGPHAALLQLALPRLGSPHPLVGVFCLLQA